MIKEAYVSFETAKLLKEKGFNESCDNYYDQNSDEPQQLTLDEMYYSYDEFIKAPTHQMAMKWLREVHDFSVEIFSIKGTSNICPIFWKGNVVKLLTQDRVFSGELVGSYEEAVEAALKYTLENLI